MLGRRFEFIDAAEQNEFLLLNDLCVVQTDETLNIRNARGELVGSVDEMRHVVEILEHFRDDVQSISWWRGSISPCEPPAVEPQREEDLLVGSARTRLGSLLRRIRIAS